MSSIDAVTLMPRTRGQALHNFANNFPVGTTRAQALRRVGTSAGAAWVHAGGPRVSRFAWSAPQGPRATLMYVSNGPAFFAREWMRQVVREVVARGRLFGQLPGAVVRLILTLAK